MGRAEPAAPPPPDRWPADRSVASGAATAMGRASRNRRASPRRERPRARSHRPTPAATAPTAQEPLRRPNDILDHLTDRSKGATWGTARPRCDRWRQAPVAASGLARSWETRRGARWSSPVDPSTRPAACHQLGHHGGARSCGYGRSGRGAGQARNGRFIVGHAPADRSRIVSVNVTLPCLTRSSSSRRRSSASAGDIPGVVASRNHTATDVGGRIVSRSVGCVHHSLLHGGVENPSLRHGRRSRAEPRR